MCDLVAAANCGLARAKPWNLPRETHGRAEIVVVIVVPRDAGIRRVLADILNGRVCAANAGFHPIGKSRSRYSPNASRSSDRKGHQASGFIWRSIIVPAHAEIQRERAPHLPIIFEKDAGFISVEIANSEWKCFVVFPCAEFRWILHEQGL